LHQSPRYKSKAHLQEVQLNRKWEKWVTLYCELPELKEMENETDKSTAAFSVSDNHICDRFTNCRTEGTGGKHVVYTLRSACHGFGEEGCARAEAGAPQRSTPG
jgi:hypothetical protein